LETLSVVIPTYNEAANIGPLLRELKTRFVGVPVEYVVIDDNSKDATAANARAEGANVVVRTTERGLATAVVRGIREARGKFVVVMDADFQHPTATVRALYDKAVASDADLVIGSRYAGGGSEGGFSAVRKTISRGARLMANVALPPVRKHHLTDPMSGLFLVRKSQVPLDALAPQGYKILLEVVAKADLRRVEEVGYTFADRRGGESKLGSKIIVQYLTHLLALAWVNPENQRFLRFCAVGVSGVVVNIGVQALFLALGLEFHFALLLGIEASIFTNFVLNDVWTFRGLRDLPWWERCGLFHLVSALTALANIVTSSALHDILGVHFLIASIVGVLVGFIPNFLGNRKFTYGGSRRPRLRSWLPVVCLAAIAGAIFFTGLNTVDGMYFDEEYYVLVAHQLDGGMLEDPYWAHDSLDQRPLNFEHPPLGKLILMVGVHGYETSHAYLASPRLPDDEAKLSTPCRILNQGAVIFEGQTNKECWTAYKKELEEHGNPWSWRGPGAIMGILLVVGVTLGTRRLFKSDLAGELAGAFVLADTMIIANARIGTLDILAAGFAGLAFWAATSPTRRGILASAILLGMGFSCKYYDAFVGVPILFVSLWVHHRAGKLTSTRILLQSLSYPLLALGVWLASYLPWWILWTKRHGLGWAVGHWAQIQIASFTWLATSDQGGQHYVSRPSEWLFMKVPVFWLGSTDCPPGSGLTCHIYATGNPALWLVSAALVVISLGLAAGWWVSGARLAFSGPRATAAQVAPALRPFAVVAAWFRSIDGRFLNPRGAFLSMPRQHQAAALAALLPLFAYGGFFLLPRDQYMFYMTIVSPFFAILAGGWAAWAWRQRGVSRGFSIAFCALVGIGFLVYAPVAFGFPVSRDYFDWIMNLWPGMYQYGRTR
jgi:dolichol-phosphate mannosyltransferase